MNFSAFIKKLRRENNELKILVLGLDNAGKTTILKSLFNLSDIVAPTFGYLTYEIPYNNHTLKILDIGGQKTIRKYWANFFEKTDGIIFTIDLSDTRDFQTYLQQIINDPFLEGIPLLIYGNKSDLKEKVEAEKICEKIHNALERENIKCMPVSAKLNYNLSEGINWLVDKIKSVDNLD